MKLTVAEIQHNPFYICIGLNRFSIVKGRLFQSPSITYGRGFVKVSRRLETKLFWRYYKKKRRKWFILTAIYYAEKPISFFSGYSHCHSKNVIKFFLVYFCIILYFSLLPLQAEYSISFSWHFRLLYIVVYWWYYRLYTTITVLSSIHNSSVTVYDDNFLYDCLISLLISAM